MLTATYAINPRLDDQRILNHPVKLPISDTFTGI